jgi:hypothetical protein
VEQMLCRGLTFPICEEARDVSPVIGLDHGYRLRRGSRNVGSPCADRAARRFPNPKNISGISIDRGSGGSLARDLRRDRNGVGASAMHELSSRRGASAAGRRSSRTQAVVWRSDTGNYGTPCGECHTQQNVALREAASYQSIPGHPRWGVAPLSMAWEGKSIGDVCRQLKDTARNGGRELAMLQEHVAKDDLVAWGWNPGAGREPAPGSQQAAGELVQAWIDSGAECPP